MGTLTLSAHRVDAKTEEDETRIKLSTMKYNLRNQRRASKRDWVRL